MSDESNASAAARQAAGPLAAQIARAYAKLIAEAIAPLNLAPAQLEVLRLLWKRDGLTQSDLARRLGVEQATMAKTVSRMLRDGLVTTTPHSRDRRALSIRLTDKASALQKEAKGAAKQVNAMAVGSLSHKEQKRFAEYGARVLAALTAGAGPAEREQAVDASSAAE